MCPDCNDTGMTQDGGACLACVNEDHQALTEAEDLNALEEVIHRNRHPKKARRGSPATSTNTGA